MENDQPIRPYGGTNWKMWAVVAALILLGIFVALNSQKVTIDFLVGEAETPLVFGLLISGALGFVIGWAGTRLRDHRRERRRVESEG